MKKNIFIITLFIILLFFSLNQNYIFGQQIDGSLSIDKSNYLLNDTRQCFIFSINNETMPVAIDGFDITFYSFGPNNRGCTNGCTVRATRYLWYQNSGQFCLNTSFTNDDVGSWSAYVVYNNKKTSSVNYQVQSGSGVNNINQSSTSTKPIFDISFKANNLTNLYLAPGAFIEYSWFVGSDSTNNLNSGQYYLDSWYTADKADKCSGGITQPNQVKPWVIKENSGWSGFLRSQIDSCQEGVNYTITIAVRDRQGNIFGSKSINVYITSKSQQGNYIPSDFCSKIEDNKEYDISYFYQILKPYFDSDKSSCDLQYVKLGIKTNADLNNLNIPYSPNGDGNGIAPGTLFKADFYYVDINNKTGEINRYKQGYVPLCSHFDNQLFTAVGLGPGFICTPIMGFTNYCISDTFSAIKNSINKLCGKSINIKSSLSSNVTSTSFGLPGSFSLPISQSSTYQPSTKFNPLDTSYFSGPIRLEQFQQNQQNQQSINFQNNTISSQKELLTSLSGTLSKLLDIIKLAENIQSNDKNYLISQIESVIKIITDLISKFINTNLSNQNQLIRQNQISQQPQGKYFIKNVGWSYVYSVEKSSDGYLIIGFLPSATNFEQKGLITKIDELGNIKWMKEFNKISFANSIKTDDGYLILGGYFYYVLHYNLIKIDENGNILFKKQIKINDYDLGFRGGAKIYKLKNGNYALVSDFDGSFDGSNEYGVALLLLDSNLNVKSSRKIIYIDKNFGLGSISLKNTLDGGYIIGGSLYNTSIENFSNNLIILIKLKSDLSLEFAKKIIVNQKFNTITRESILVNDIEELDDKSYLLIGNKYDFMSGLGYAFILKISSDGAVNKFKAYDQFSLLRSINKNLNNNYLLSGLKKDNNYYGIVAQVDSNLNLLNYIKIDDGKKSISLAGIKDFGDYYLIFGNIGVEGLLAKINKNFSLDKQCSDIVFQNINNDSSFKDYPLSNLEVSDVSDKIKINNLNLKDEIPELNISTTTRNIIDYCK
ncbi:MAG: hypothetical protein NZ484_02020 [Patescibacteria group bacterium]|nr:hypothetical protein [Patescibacteria group bacterium]MDW8279557.1 hypothetical protein [bacterium]